MRLDVAVPFEKGTKGYKDYLKNFRIYTSVQFQIHYAQLSYKRFLKKDRHPWDISSDAHSFLIAVANLKGHLKLFRAAFDDKTLNKMIDRQNDWLYQCAQVRDEIEHVYDGRLEGKTKGGKDMLEPSILGSLEGNELNFGGIKIDLKESFQRLEKFVETLEIWNKSNHNFPRLN